MQSRILHPLLPLIACAASAVFASTTYAAGSAPVPGSAAPVFGQPATAPGGIPGSAMAPAAAGAAQWDMDGKTERREKRKRSTSDGTELWTNTEPWTNSGGTREDATQKTAPAFP